MLLVNNTEIQFTLHVHLEFDTGATKDVTINAGDYILIKFKYDGMTMYRACRVVDIQPIVLQTQPVSYASQFMIDCSTKFAAERLRVASKDILNVRIVNKDYIDSLAPDYVVTEGMVSQGALEPVPEEEYARPGVGIMGIGEARLIR